VKDRVCHCVIMKVFGRGVGEGPQPLWCVTEEEEVVTCRSSGEPLEQHSLATVSLCNSQCVTV